jgi:large subunit ribosomal protein L22
MDIRATTRYVRISPSKARDLARAITGLPVPKALEITEFTRRKAATLIGKTLKSAIANAENNDGLAADELYVRAATIEEGPRLKRFQPVARGAAHPIVKKTSHIKIVLTDSAPSGR